ncbi:MAG: hypothetical protein ACRDDL_03760 [Sarcina sp.]
MNNKIPAIKLINLTDKTMRDIRITYEGLDREIEILKIKKEYEKVVFLDIPKNNIIKNFSIVYDKNNFILEEINCSKDLVTIIEIFNSYINIRYVKQ